MKKGLMICITVAVMFSLQAQNVKKMERVGNKKNKIDYQQEYQRLTTENDRLSKEVKELRYSEQTKQKEINALNADKNGLRTALQAKQNEVKKLQAELDATISMRDLNAKQRAEIDNLKSRLAKTQSELNSMSSQKEKVESLQRQINALQLENKNLKHDNAKLKAAHKGKASNAKDSTPRVEHS